MPWEKPPYRRSKYSEDGASKSCCACQKFFPIDHFYKTSKGKLRPYCVACHKERAAAVYIRDKEKIRAQNLRYLQRPGAKEKQKERVRRWHYRTEYGITIEQKAEMIAAQNGKCPICQVDFASIKPNRVHVDHDHWDGAIRGILCHKCNIVLGQAQDRVDVLEAAIRYLDYHSGLKETCGC